MQNHEENLASRVNGSLQPLLGVMVTVKTLQGLLATIYFDDGVTVQPNPMFTNANGLYGFRAANGPYKLTFSGPQIESYERDIDLYDPDDEPPLTQAQAALPSAASRVGFQAEGLGTQGRTIENKLRETVSVKDFGAVGDGVADDYPAIQAALDWAETAVVGNKCGVRIKFPRGEYRMSQLATCNIAPTGTVSTTGMVSVHLTGDGDTATAIVADPANTTGCIRLTSDRNTECFRVAGMSFLSDLPEDAPTNNGIALQIDSSLAPGAPGFGDHPRWSVSVENVFIGGYGSNAGELARRGNWQKGIFVKNKWYPKFSGVRCLARYSAILGARTACDYAIHLYNCYSPDLSDIYVHGNWNRGVYAEGVLNAEVDVEDFRLVDSFLVGQNYGFEYAHSYSTIDPEKLYEPGGAISNVHVNCKIFGITLKNHRQVQITNVYGYANNSVAAQGELLPAIIKLDGCADIMIDAQFLEPGFYVSKTNASVGVRIEGASEAIYIAGQFGNGGIGVLNNSTYTTRKSIVVEVKLATSRRTGAWPTLQLLVDNAGSATSVQNLLGSQQDVRELSTGKAFGASYPVAYRLAAKATGQMQCGAYEIAGPNSAGAQKNVLIQRGSFTNNTAGAEASAVSTFLLNAGGVNEAWRLEPPSTDNDSYGLLAVRISGGLVLKRIRVGAADSGGTGKRALIVDN